MNGTKRQLKTRQLIKEIEVEINISLLFYSEVIRKMLKSMPLMPDLNINFTGDEEEEEDAKEEKNLMTILLKLKSAKSTLETNRKRKHNQQAIEDAYKQVSKENKDQLAKYKKRWSTKTGQVLL
jgi:predicted RND superfamily exporter protein